MTAMTDSHLGREIAEQPEVLQRLLDEERASIEYIANIIRERDPQFVMIVARGTSDNAARYGQYMFGAFNQLPVALAAPSLYTLYGKPPRMKSGLVLAISQSGQSPDIVSVVQEGREQGALTVTITNNTESPLAQAADHVINLHAHREYGIAASKSYTASLLALALLSAALADDQQRLEALDTVPDYVAQVVANAESIVKAAERYRYVDACVVISRGYNYGTAFEVALKLKELTYIIAEPYSSADFRHGPIAMVERGFPVMVIIPDGYVEPELSALITLLDERGAELIVIAANPGLLALAQTPLALPPHIPEWVSPVVAVVPGQLFALGLTLAKRLDPDQPRGLFKVTLTQ